MREEPRIDVEFAGQLVQFLLSDAPMAEEKVPFGQRLQNVEPEEPEYVPT
jgi:hypothetical protein